MQGNLFNKLKNFLGHENREEDNTSSQEKSSEEVQNTGQMSETQVPEEPKPLIEKAEGDPEAKPAHSEEEIKQEVVKVLKTCYDPEIPVDVFELGLIYDIKVATNGDVLIIMTLTSPACPVAGSLPLEIEQKVREHPMVHDCKVQITFDPPWNQRMMSEVALLELGFL
jgi:FeS assembly SUF system protein